MRVAVTGATGFIGGRIARRLSAAGHEVLGLGRRPSADVAAEVAYRRWDLGDPGMKAPAELADVDAVVHSAAHVADWGPDATFQLVTVDGTARLLDACRGARIVVVGSASVYDPYRVHPCAREEDAPVARYRNGYGRAKAAQERLVLVR